jgi:alpha-ketoglutarate-dependent taurine dioxygenase
MTIFLCTTEARFLQLRDAIAGHVASHGYAVIEAWDAETATLRAIAERFGRVQSHIRADANGLVGISTETVVNREWENYRSEYHGVSSEEFLPHTDGSYLNGLVHRDSKYIQLLPPKMLLLQCWQQAAAGGASILIDGERVRRDLARQHPRCLDILSTPGCVTYCRDDQIALDSAVFQRLDDGTIMLRFRYDGTAYLADWAFDAFHMLQNEYFSDPRYHVSMTLAKGQVALIDNYRMLHGRASFSDAAAEAGKKRSLRRIWLAYDGLRVLRNAIDQHKDRRALLRFKAYDILPASSDYAAAAPMPIGIRLAA